MANETILKPFLDNGEISRHDPDLLIEYEKKYWKDRVNVI
jgi:hypothetical protein